jgi:hypothetical protein
LKKENEKLVLKCEMQAKKDGINQILDEPSTPPSMASSSCAIDEKDDAFNDESFNDLNQMIVTSIPEKMRNERLK